MTDDRDMASNHLDDCLDYLYEELPPEGMAEARRHLAECPACRAEMKKVRETVKQYRDAPKPVPPPGLALRTAARVLARTDAEVAAEVKTEAEQPETPAQAGGLSEAEFARLKEEILEEAPRGWRTWFYHPAWMVAASVVFVCSLLIHFSPRYGARPDHAAPIPAAAPASMKEKAAPGGKAAAASETSSLQARKRLPPAAPLRQAETAIPDNALSQPALREADAWTREMESADKAEVWVPSPPAAAPQPAPAASLRPPPAPAARPEELTGSSAAPFAAAPPPAVAGKRVNGRSSGPVIVDMFNPAEPPQLVPRPTPIDTVKLARDLATLAGMQISHGELAEAWLSLGMLRKYDAEKADELTRVLEAKEAELAAARATAPAKGDAEAMDAAAAPAAEPAAPGGTIPPGPKTLEEQAPAQTGTPVLPAVPLFQTVEPAPAKRPIFSTDPYVRGD